MSADIGHKELDQLDKLFDDFVVHLNNVAVGKVWCLALEDYLYNEVKVFNKNLTILGYDYEAIINKTETPLGFEVDLRSKVPIMYNEALKKFAQEAYDYSEFIKCKLNDRTNVEFVQLVEMQRWFKKLCSALEQVTKSEVKTY